MITAERVRKLAPNARADLVMALVKGWPKIRDAGINTPLRVAHFMTQIATETGGFTIYEENMNYSAQRLTEVWPSRFPSTSAALPYARNPEKLANYVYADANRSAAYKLGNTQPGDGWRYRGRGFIQTTGREGYRKVGHEDDPDTLTQPEEGLKAAIAEFVRSGCLALADADNLTGIRKRINGGTIGIEHARAFLPKAKAIFTAMPEAKVPPPPDIEPTPKPVPAPTVKPEGAAGAVIVSGGTAAVMLGWPWWAVLGLVVALGVVAFFGVRALKK